MLAVGKRRAGRKPAAADRLEVHSPGSLPNGVAVEKATEGPCVPRNSNIVNILRDYDFMEHRGMGIRRKVIPLTRAHNGTDPQFDATEDYFEVTLRKQPTPRVVSRIKSPGKHVIRSE